MKNIFKKIIVAIITFEAKLVLKKYKPKIIAITGTVGKTSAKEAIAAVLDGSFYVRKNIESYNSEIGTPLTILGLKNAWFSLFGWLKNILAGAFLILKNKNYPRILILELGVDKPGDIEKFIKWIKPDAGVVTALGDVPVHVEFFASPEALRTEKAKILRPLKIKDKAILNYDDETVLELKDKTRAETLTFGVAKGANVLGSNYKIMFRKEGDGEIPEGITFKVDYKGSSVPFRIYNTFGKQQMYACLAAAACGIAFGINLVKISEFLTRYQSPPGRLKLLKGIKNTLILDDTYNSSPMATHAALDTLKEFSVHPAHIKNGGAKRKIAVFGDMLELGKFTINSHREIGQLAAKICDLIFTVGPRAKFIAEEAREIGFPKENIFEFSDSLESGIALQKQIKEGDLILIKGSQAMRMERAVEEIMANPEEKDKLLVRQDAFWKNVK